MTHSPYLSLVVTSRNDDDQILSRMQLFIDTLMDQADRFQLDCELVIVEWNPPSNRPSLGNALRWSPSGGQCNVRIIHIPPEIHERFENSDVIPLFQMIAKNIGIRRARGRFILATNVDILFSNELAYFLAAKKLRSDRMYRVDRYDVRADVPANANLLLDERLTWCREHVLRVYRYMEVVEAKNGIIPPPGPDLPPWKRFKNWVRGHQYPLHTNACGDFTLLSAEYWQTVGGHPEFPLRAMKLDGLLCYAAHYAGAREVVLKNPLRIYHLDHPARSDGAIIALSKRDSDSRNLQLLPTQYRTWIEQMQQSRHPVVFNDSSWGLAGEEFLETVIG